MGAFFLKIVLLQKFYQDVVFYNLTCSLHIYYSFWFVIFYGISACMDICVSVSIYISCDFSLTLFLSFVSSYSSLVGFVFHCSTLLLFFRCLFFLTRGWIFDWEARWRGSGMSWERKNHNQIIVQEKSILNKRNRTFH